MGAGLFVYFVTRINYTPLDDFALADTVPTDEIDSDADSSFVEVDNPESMQFASGDLLYDPRVQNILLIGSDSRGGSGYGRSDSMMLLSIDRKNGRIILTSFLRDMYVKIAEVEGKTIKDNRINVAFGYGGPKLLVETIQNNFRIRIDNYVCIDFQVFVDVIDAVGGIDISLTYKEARELNNNPSRYSDGGRIQRVSEGMNHLNGATALAYARIRKIDSDFGRTQRQRNVIQTVITQLRHSDVSTIMGIVNTYVPQIINDLGLDGIAGLAMESGTLMSFPITQCTIPAPGTYSNRKIRDMAVLVPDIDANKAILWALLYNR